MISSTNENCTPVKKNLRGLKAKEVVVGRRRSLAPNQILNAKDKDGKSKESGFNTLSRKIMKSVRKSLAPNDVKSLKEIQDREAVEEAERRKQESEAREQERNEKYGLNRKSMRFAEMKDDPKISQYWTMIEHIDPILSGLGGMIKLHQFSHEAHKSFGWPISRDAANFFRDADLGCINVANQVPIRMVYLDLLDCETVEKWFRDYYSRRDLNRHEVENSADYCEDTYTTFDQVFDETGRDAFRMMCEEMHMMENYCAMKARTTNLKEYKLGVEFWRKASPLHLPRNYQLALLYCKRNEWNHELIEHWFRMFYTEKSWIGARGKDVYSDEHFV